MGADRLGRDSINIIHLLARGRGDVAACGTLVVQALETTDARKSRVTCMACMMIGQGVQWPEWSRRLHRLRRRRRRGLRFARPMPLTKLALRPCGACGRPTPRLGMTPPLCDDCVCIAERDGIWNLLVDDTLPEGSVRCRRCEAVVPIARFSYGPLGRIGLCSGCTNYGAY
jgi:hypothetical protein